MLRNIFALLVSFLFAVSPAQAAAEETLYDDDFRAVWVCTVANLDWPSKTNLTITEMKAEADAIINRAAALGLNAVVLQVRPSSDAIYKSDIFPWSDVLTGTQGIAPADGFDPLLYWIEQCRKNDIELHAWINPYRAARTASAALSADNPARLNPSRVIQYGDIKVYDPGQPENRELIINGVAEIINKYDVDGIHMDDYFYPYPIAGETFQDGASFRAYGGGMNLNDWRRENVDLLIKEMQKKITELDPNVRFGISPFAIWKNQKSDPLGSDTSGLESYSAIYADSYKWVKEGWVDYIAPQIYWHIGFSVADYKKVLDWWADVVKDTDVDLYVGHAVYREVQGDAGWSAGEIGRQLQLNTEYDAVKGSIFFRMGFMNGPVGNGIGDFYADKPQVIKQREPEIKMTKLTVAQPAGNISVAGAEGYTVHGTSDPDQDLFINGNPVTNRTPEGFFSAYVGLSRGANTFTFTQDGQQSIGRVITVTQGGGGSTTTTPTPQVTDIPRGDKYIATVTADSAWVYPGPTSTTGSSWLLKQGQKDIITGKTSDDKWTRLSCGAWIETANISRAYDTGFPASVLGKGVYEQNELFDAVIWKSDTDPAVYVTYEDGKVNMHLGIETAVPDLDIPDLEKTVFTGIASEIYDGVPTYSFLLKDNAKIEGVYTVYADGELRLILKKRKKAADTAMPLTGFRFVIDAGHGGTESGAIGPMGDTNTEKDINLKHAHKLAARLRWLGAEVEMTREGDDTLTLYERTEFSRMQNPDLFISIHANSVAEVTDSSNIKGLTVWYRNEIAKPFALLLGDLTADVNPGTTRASIVNTSNFYVCRPLWTPSVIIETSFMCNIWDYAWLISDARQNEWADRTAAAILSYYK